MRLESLTAKHEHAALEYLEQAPYENVFLIDMLSVEPEQRARGQFYIVFEADRVQGVAFFGRQTVIAAQPNAIPELAQLAPRFSGTRMIVGPREQIIPFWHAIGPKFPKPRIVRERQYVMVLVPEHLHVYDTPHVSARQARSTEWQEVADNSAEMIRGELGYDPRKASNDFGVNVRMMIARGMWWVGEYSNGGTPQLCFFCHTGPQSDRTLQLQGIWTPPALRGHGLATAAFSGICSRLLTSVPTLSLYVNDFNSAAIRLYERLGFQTTGEFQTIMF